MRWWRREDLNVSDENVEQEVARHAKQLGQTPAAVRARLESDDGIARLSETMRREKAIDLLMSRATIVTA